MTQYRIVKRSIDVGNHKEEIIYTVQVIDRACLSPDSCCLHCNDIREVVSDRYHFGTLGEAVKCKENLELKDGIVVG